MLLNINYHTNGKEMPKHFQNNLHKTAVSTREALLHTNMHSRWDHNMLGSRRHAACKAQNKAHACRVLMWLSNHS